MVSPHEKYSPYSVGEEAPTLVVHFYIPIVLFLISIYLYIYKEFQENYVPELNLLLFSNIYMLFYLS